MYPIRQITQDGTGAVAEDVAGVAMSSGVTAEQTVVVAEWAVVAE